MSEAMTPWNEPFERFAALFAEARAAIPQDPNAMQLATVGADGRPAVRTVLMKDFDTRGWVFFGNHLSRKGRDLAAHPVAALNFFWPVLGVQVRIEGQVAPVSEAESDAYFATRPRPSQVGAWASLQSQPLDSRGTLEARVEELARAYQGRSVPRPKHWGGWRLSPDHLEFWKAHPDRLHWREVYDRAGEGWTRSMLYP
jgi:pyridoxamine 5'-phosphate oxidase